MKQVSKKNQYLSKQQTSYLLSSFKSYDLKLIQTFLREKKINIRD